MDGWISNYIHYKVCLAITYPIPNFNRITVEVWEWHSYDVTVMHLHSPYNHHIIFKYVITHPCCDYSSMLFNFCKMSPDMTSKLWASVVIVMAEIGRVIAGPESTCIHDVIDQKLAGSGELMVAPVRFTQTSGCIIPWQPELKCWIKLHVDLIEIQISTFWWSFRMASGHRHPSD